MARKTVVTQRWECPKCGDEVTCGPVRALEVWCKRRHDGRVTAMKLVEGEPYPQKVKKGK
jgi:hypothetical protein